MAPIVHGKNEDFTVADFSFLTGAGRVDDGFNGGFDVFVVNGDFQFDFPDEIDLIFVAAVHLGMPFLTAMPCTSDTVHLNTSMWLNASLTASAAWLDDGY